MSAGRTLTAPKLFGLLLVGSLMYPNSSKAQFVDAFHFDDPMEARAWSDCSAKASLSSKTKAVGNYVAFPLDGPRLVLAKNDQIDVYTDPKKLSQVDKLNGLVWQGSITVEIEGPVQVYQAQDGRPVSTATWKWEDGKDIGTIVQCYVEIKKSGPDRTEVLPWRNQFRELAMTVQAVFKDRDHVPFPGWK